MTEQDERQRKALASLDLQEAEARHTDRLQVASDLAKKYRGLAEVLETDPGNLAVDCYEKILDYSHLEEVVSDIKTAENELQKASEHAATMNKL